MNVHDVMECCYTLIMELLIELYSAVTAKIENYFRYYICSFYKDQSNSSFALIKRQITKSPPCEINHFKDLNLCLYAFKAVFSHSL